MAKSRLAGHQKTKPIQSQMGQFREFDKHDCRRYHLKLGFLEKHLMTAAKAVFKEKENEDMVRTAERVDLLLHSGCR